MGISTRAGHDSFVAKGFSTYVKPQGIVHMQLLVVTALHVGRGEHIRKTENYRLVYM